MLVVTALGGNALLARRADDRREPAPNVRIAAEALAPVAANINSSSATATARRSGCSRCKARPTSRSKPIRSTCSAPQTEGMIGYMIEQELGNLLPFERPFATLLTMIEVDPADPAFKNPTKFIGPVYDQGGRRPPGDRTRSWHRTRARSPSSCRGRGRAPGVVAEVEAARRVSVRLQARPSHRRRPRPDGAGDLERGAGLHLRRIGRTRQRKLGGADNSGRGQQRAAEAHSLFPSYLDATRRRTWVTHDKRDALPGDRVISILDD